MSQPPGRWGDIDLDHYGDGNIGDIVEGGVVDGDGEGEDNDDINNVSHGETDDVYCDVDNSGNGNKMSVMLMMERVTYGVDGDYGDGMQMLMR